MVLFAEDKIAFLPQLLYARAMLVEVYFLSLSLSGHC